MAAMTKRGIARVRAIAGMAMAGGVVVHDVIVLLRRSRGAFAWSACPRQESNLRPAV